MKKLTKQAAASSIIFILMLFAGNGLFVSAQTHTHEISVSGGGGFSAFCFQPVVKKYVSAGFSAETMLGYTGFISQQWGIHTGLGLGMNNVKNKIDKLVTVIPDLIDKNRYLYDLHSTLNQYEETHKTIYLYAPLMLQFQTKTKPVIQWKKGQKASFYVMAGAKALFLFHNKYEAKTGSLKNAAYYPEFDNWAATQIFAGLSTFDGSKIDGKFKINVSFMFAFEAGIKWRIGNTLYLYTGTYFDYGLNDPSKKIRKPFEHFTSPEKMKDLSLLKIAEKAYLMSVGIKLRLSFVLIPKITSCKNCFK